MDIPSAVLDFSPGEYIAPAGEASLADGAAAARLGRAIDPLRLRAVAWEVGELRAGEAYAPAQGHVGLAMVDPHHGYAHWRIPPAWVDEISATRGRAWEGCRPILRLYDVSFIEFNGFNAHRIQDEALPALEGHRFFRVPAGGTWQLAEVGFLLRSGEFLPAARSSVVPFGSDRPSGRGGTAGLLVLPGRAPEPIGNVWDQERELRERRRAALRGPLRVAAFAFAAREAGHSGPLADFVSELAQGTQRLGHEVHVFVPATPALDSDRVIDGVHWHALTGVPADEAPMDRARAYALAAESRLAEVGPFDFYHLHEWMTALGSWATDRPCVLSLSSLEVTRRNGAEATPPSREIEEVERRVVRGVRALLTPDWLCARAIAELGVESDRVHAFAMEGRLANEWETPLDFGQVKQSVGIGPIDRMLLYVGPIEHGAGVDLPLESLPVVLRRSPDVRLAYIGNGSMRGHLESRAHEMGVAHAVRFLGDRGGRELTHLVRAAEALLLPSRQRIAMDDAVVDLARRAGRPVVTTHGGPAYLVRHEETGLVTYDNPGSMVWAIDRIVSDPTHTGRMGQNGRRVEAGTLRWSDVAGLYLEGCLNWFPELTASRL